MKKRTTSFNLVTFTQVTLLASALALAGCKSGQGNMAGKSCGGCTESGTAARSSAAAAPAPTTASTPAAATLAPAAAPALAAPAPVPAGPVRIKAGASGPVTDAEGNVWLADQGFEDGEITDRADDLPIANTKSPALYRSEHYSMSTFSRPVPNGSYIVKLHFAETYEGITGPGQRVFSFSVNGHEFKDFDVWVKAGGAQKAYIETVPVEVTNGKVEVKFTPNADNPEVNAIEILPAPKS